jgi:hypothetical protein
MLRTQGLKPGPKQPPTPKKAAPLPPVRSGLRKSNPPGINALDYSISQHNGYTIALEFSAQRLQSMKYEPVPDLQTRLEELVRETGYLRHESNFYRECFGVLQRLRETSYDVYQQLFLESYFPTDGDRLSRLTIQLHHGLEDSIRREVAAEKEWKAFWGLDVDEIGREGELI